MEIVKVIIVIDSSRIIEKFVRMLYARCFVPVIVSTLTFRNYLEIDIVNRRSISGEFDFLFALCSGC